MILEIILLPSDFSRHSLNILLSACVTPHLHLSLDLLSLYLQGTFPLRYYVLRHTRRPTLSDSLEGRFEKAKSSRSLLPFPCILPILSGREPNRLIPGSFKLKRKSQSFFSISDDCRPELECLSSEYTLKAGL